MWSQRFAEVMKHWSLGDSGSFGEVRILKLSAVWYFNMALENLPTCKSLCRWWAFRGPFWLATAGILEDTSDTLRPNIWKNYKCFKPPTRNMWKVYKESSTLPKTSTRIYAYLHSHVCLQHDNSLVIRSFTLQIELYNVSLLCHHFPWISCSSNG